MNVLTQIPKRVLANGLVVFVRELNIKESGASFSWFEYGMMHRREGINPCKFIPEFLNDRLHQAAELEDHEASINTLLKIGDWLAGWIWAQMNSKETLNGSS